MKRIALSSTLLASLLAVSAAQADTHSTINDTYVKIGSGDGYGNLTTFAVSKTGDGAGKDTRKGVFTFWNPYLVDVLSAELLLDVVSYSDPSVQSATYYVWGMRDATSGCGELFDENTAKYSTFPFFDSSPDGMNNTSTCLYDANPSVAQAQALGSFTVRPSDVGTTVEFSSQALTDFFNTDTDTYITLAITAATNSSSLVTSFATWEHSTASSARLRTKRSGLVNRDDPDTLQGVATQNADGSTHFEGDLHVPIDGINEVVIPGANVDMTFFSNGELKTISGTVGFPELPGMGMFSSLGPLSSSGPALQIGYDYPSAFNTLDLPLMPAKRYFYFLQQSGASVEWGPLSASSPDSGATMFALEPNGPTIFFYSDQLFPESPVGAVSLGVSGSNDITFSPWYTNGVESQMVSFNGDLYLGGTISIPTTIPAVEATITGDMTVDVKDANFASGDPLDWIQDLGVNADVALEAGLGVFGLSYYIGGASLLYHRGGTPSLTFAGVIEPDDLGGLPFVPQGSAYVAGYLSGNVSDSFLEIDGDMKFGTAFSQQTIDGYVRIDSAGAIFDGRAKFSGTTFNVSGEIYPDHGKFSGSISHKFNAYIGKVKTTISASFDSRNTKVELGASAKFCVTEPITGHDECTSVGSSVSLNGSGQVRVCANVPGYGTSCDTLS